MHLQSILRVIGMNKMIFLAVDSNNNSNNNNNKKEDPSISTYRFDYFSVTALNHLQKNTAKNTNKLQLELHLKRMWRCIAI